MFSLKINSTQKVKAYVKSCQQRYYGMTILLRSVDDSEKSRSLRSLIALPNLIITAPYMLAFATRDLLEFALASRGSVKLNSSRSCIIEYTASLQMRHGINLASGNLFILDVVMAFHASLKTCKH
jgi:hypothetical protein